MEKAGKNMGIAKDDGGEESELLGIWVVEILGQASLSHSLGSDFFCGGSANNYVSMGMQIIIHRASNVTRNRT